MKKKNAKGRLNLSKSLYLRYWTSESQKASTFSAPGAFCLLFCKAMALRLRLFTTVALYLLPEYNRPWPVSSTQPSRKTMSYPAQTWEVVSGFLKSLPSGRFLSLILVSRDLEPYKRTPCPFSSQRISQENPNPLESGSLLPNSQLKCHKLYSIWGIH